MIESVGHNRNWCRFLILLLSLTQIFHYFMFFFWKTSGNTEGWNCISRRQPQPSKELIKLS